MKSLPRRAAKEIAQAQAALEACLQNPATAPQQIQAALKHVTEANQWIVARVLRENYLKQNQGAKR